MASLPGRFHNDGLAVLALGISAVVLTVGGKIGAAVAVEFTVLSVPAPPAAGASAV
jgi:hypothetical protein